MRKLLLIFALVSFVAMSCTDKDYDLDNLDDNFAIGDVESQFLAPLATLSFHADSFSHHSDERTETIIDVYEEADIWLPTTIPGGVDYVEVERLMHDVAYLDTIVKALIAEMESSPAKADKVYHLVATKHKADYLAAVKSHVTSEVYAALEAATVDESVAIIRQLFEADHSWAVEAIENICEGRLDDLSFDDVVYDIPSLDVSDDIKEMIMGNIGHKGDTSNPNKLFIAGSVDSGFPFDIGVSPSIEHTSIAYTNVQLYFGKDAELSEKQIYIDDVEHLFNGSRAIIGFTIERYYPGRVDISKQEAHIILHLRKTGCLTL